MPTTDRSLNGSSGKLIRLLSPAVLLIAAVVLFPQEADAQRRKKNEFVRAQDSGGVCDTARWKLVFHDEFNGNGLDLAKWYPYLPYSDDGSDQCDGCRYMSGSNSIFRDEMIRVDNGSLKLGVATRSGTWYGHDAEYEGSVIRTKGGVTYTYGRFEVRCRIPSGNGLWPAFWGFGGQTEIDVFELCGEKPKWMKGSLHNWVEPKHSNTGKHKSVDLSKEMHRYAVEWEEDEVRWYLDDELVHSRGRFVDKKGRPLPACGRSPGKNALAPYYPRSEDGISLILDLVVSNPGGYCKGPKKRIEFPADAVLEVDWIRAYQRHPTEPRINLCAQARTLRVEPAGRSLRPGEECTVTIEGPHGAMEWETGAGLRTTARTERGITVTPSGQSGASWVRASCERDPCTQGPATFEAQVELAR